MLLPHQQPIGVFDSGIGGLSVANAIYSLLPAESMVYFADTGHIPYGPRPKEEIRQFSHEITAYLLAQGCKMIVVACNTATGAALEYLRHTWPDVTFVGMEPAVKPAAAATRNNRVGVLATLSTIRSERYAQLMQRYAHSVHVQEDPCLGLVPLIEAGALDTPETESLLRTVLTPMLDSGIDTLVLGCTHYPFVLPTIRRIIGDTVTVIDPAPAVARQVAKLLHQHQLANDAALPPEYRFVASGSFVELARLTEIPFSGGK